MQTTRTVGDFVIALQDKKRKAYNNNKYYKYGKLGHFGQNCFFPNKRFHKNQY